MYNWNQFTNLSGIKDLPKDVQIRQYYKYQNEMYEAASNAIISPAAAAAAAAGSGGGRLIKPTPNGSSVLFIDDQKSEWEYFIVDEKGVKTDRLSTGVSASDYYSYDIYVIQNKGYVITFRDYDTDYFYYVVFIGQDGKVIRKDYIENGLDQYNQTDGKFFYYNAYVDGGGRKVTYFDGVSVYDSLFDNVDSTLHIAWNANQYIYETNSIFEDSTDFTDKSTSAGLIAYDDLDGGTSSIWYSLYEGNTVVLFQEEDGYNYDVSWDFQSGFLSVIKYDYGTGYYSSLALYDCKTGELSRAKIGPFALMNIPLFTEGQDFNYVEYVYFGTSKFAAIFYNDTDCKIIYYDGISARCVIETHDLISYNFDFNCTVRVPRTGTSPWGSDDFQNFISESIVFSFANYDYYDYPFDYYTDVDYLYIDETGSYLNTLPSGTGIELHRGLFTENGFATLANAGDIAENTLSQLIINSSGYTFSAFGFSASEVDDWSYWQMDNSYVYKFYFSGLSDDFYHFDKDGQLTGSISLSPNNGQEENRGLYLIHNYDTYDSYYLNSTTGGQFATMSDYYGNDYWRTFYNYADGVNDGSWLLTDNTYRYYAYVCDTAAPVYYDFSFLDTVDNWNIYLCKSFIVVQTRESNYDGVMRVYDLQGNLIQEENFGYCEWISSDSRVGDIAAIRFTNWGFTKRVFVTKNTRFSFDIDWGYGHSTLFNDYAWWND